MSAPGDLGESNGLLATGEIRLVQFDERWPTFGKSNRRFVRALAVMLCKHTGVKLNSGCKLGSSP